MDRLVLRRNADRPSVYKGFLIRQARFDATVYHGDRIGIEQQPPPGAGPRPPAGTVTGSGDDIIVHEGLVSVVDGDTLQRVVCAVPVTSVKYIESTDEGE